MNHDVHLRVEGALLERLIERALNRGARFARVRRTGPRRMVFSTDERSAEILISLCKKYFLEYKILRRGGWTAMKDTLRARWTLAPGILLGLILCALFLSRLWLVDVRFTGPAAELGKDAEILAALESAGVRQGMAASLLDASDLQKQLLAACGDYSFIGVRRQGVRLLVEASPEVPAPELYALNRPRDLIAARDGVIESITVHSGVACVKIGDTVRAGQVLIRGEEDKSKEETTPVAALGEVVARCWYEGSAEAPLQRKVREYTGQTHAACRLKLMDFSFPISQCEGFAEEEVEIEILPVGGLFLPLEIERSIHMETRIRTENVDEAQVENRLNALAIADARRKIAAAHVDIQAATVWLERKKRADALCVRAVYEIYTDIAVTRDALIEEVY